MCKSKLPSHFVGVEGALYDTRKQNWFREKPLRACYSLHHRDIQTTQQLKATLRAGACTWPGGYPLFFMTADGGALAFSTVRQNLREVLDAIKRNERHSSWRVVAVEVNWEDPELTDNHTGELIESAYGKE